MVHKTAESKPISFIDSHCHLHDAEFFDRPTAENLITAANDQSVAQIVCIGTSHADSLQAADFATSHPDIFWTYGFHPETANISQIKTLLFQIDSYVGTLKSILAKTFDTKFEPPVAIGEIGLDYHYPNFNRANQITLLEAQLHLATDLNLPVAFHIREAFDDFFAIIKNFPKITGVVHSFSDTQENLHKSLELGFYIGVNGIATFANIPIPPLNHIVLETDAPFLAPAPMRGKPNQPAYIPHIAKFLAAKFQLPISQVAEITSSNTKNLYRLHV